MSKKALVPVNVLASGTNPAGQHAGDLYFNTSDIALYTYTGSTWAAVSGGDIDGGSAIAVYTGTSGINGGNA